MVIVNSDAITWTHPIYDFQLIINPPFQIVFLDGSGRSELSPKKLPYMFMQATNNSTEVMKHCGIAGNGFCEIYTPGQINRF